MFSFFRKKTATLHSISITDLGWPVAKHDQQIIQWKNPEQTVAVSINFFDLPPDIPASKDIQVIRDFYRNMVSRANGGIIDVSLCQLQQHTAIHTLLKLPQEPRGTMYLACLTLPFKNCSYVLKVQAVEAGPTGMREAFIADRLLNTQGRDALSNWAADPYDPHFQEGALMNMSEQPIHDASFPKHPLTIARQLILQIQSGFQQAPEIDRLLPFYRE